jgi:dihydroorotate dehydrogenase
MTIFEALYPSVRDLLFQLDAEQAHHWTMDALRFAEKCRLLPTPPAPTGPPVRVMGLDFPNRVGLAAGLDKEARCVAALGALGFGHIEVGTITPRPQPGNPAPRLFRLIDEEAIINRMGFNNPGLTQALKNLTAHRWPGLVGFNIGKNFDTPNERAVDDYLLGLRGAYTAADYIAVNISSPNTKGLRDLQQQEAIRALVQALKAEQVALAQTHQKYTPIAIKIAPDLTPEAVKIIADILATAQIDAVIATNTTIDRAAVSHHPYARQAGGLSGRPVTQAATSVIRQLYAVLGTALPIIGVGGIFSVADAQEKIEAGAQLVQIYTSFVYRGPALVRELALAL